MSPSNLKILNNPPIILFTKTAILIQPKFLYKTDIFPQNMVTSTFPAGYYDALCVEIGKS